ncbi:CAP domain-containing protein [uncultured Paracoccus sp.]|uniref:CAP domain-containing protein n=1 Tax=uncultured Paracoccus sp. TaxID=189685 RepID=UPI002634CD5D|nr:CAP domain-containing protein [uncultured Paracoccus sp.]
MAAGQEPDDIEALRQRALDLVNESRQAEELDPLTLGDDAVEAAQAHADDMFERDYYAHVSPEGETVQDRYIDAGGSRWQLAAENIARCSDCSPPATGTTVQDLHDGWMDSPGHRKNILAPGLSTFGFGLTIGADQGLYAVQTFAGPGVPRGLEPDEEPIALTAAEQGERALDHVNGARDRESLPALKLHQALSQAAANLLPPPEQEEFVLSASQDLPSALPGGERTEWASLSVLAGACGGCGTVVAAADIREFVRGWHNDPQYRASLLDPEATHLGFALQTNGKGRKIALVVLGRPH